MTPVSDQERYRRVEEEGSKRKRDLAGHVRVRAARAARRSKRLAELADPLPLAAVEAWTSALEHIRASVPESTFQLWIEPLEAVAAVDETLHLAAPEGIQAWVERRYSALIAKALVAADTGLRHVSFAAPWEPA